MEARLVLLRAFTLVLYIKLWDCFRHYLLRTRFLSLSRFSLLGHAGLVCHKI
jgi:hypothetical protein